MAVQLVAWFGWLDDCVVGCLVWVVGWLCSWLLGLGGGMTVQLVGWFFLFSLPSRLFHHLVCSFVV